MFYYGYLKLIIGMKLPKYNVCYNTRGLITSLAEKTNDRNDKLFYQCIQAAYHQREERFSFQTLHLLKSYHFVKIFLL